MSQIKKFPVEALVVGIFYFEGGNQVSPATRNVRNLNPGNLRPTQREQAQEENYRIFNTMWEGFKALSDDIEYKL